MKNVFIEWNINAQDYRQLSLKNNTGFWIVGFFISILSAILLVDTFFLNVSLLLLILSYSLSTIGSLFLFYWYIVGIQTLYLKKHPEILGTAQCTINQEGIRLGNQENFMLLPWNRINKVKESKKYLLIQSSKKEKILIPKRAFDNVQEEQETIHFMNNNILTFHS